MSMPEKFNALARYNTEVGNGVQHTPELDARMADLQREYYEWLPEPVTLQQVTRPAVGRRLIRFLGIRERWDMP